MAKREKKVVVTNVTSEQVEQAFADYARADAQEEKITATINLAITAIREKYQNDLATLAARKEVSFDVLQQYALEQKEALFTKRKSLELTHGVIGFRTGTPKLKTLKGFTWPAITNLLKEFLPTYVRIVEEPAKDKLLADRDDDDVRSLFSKVGICVDQDETFFVEPKKENVSA